MVTAMVTGNLPPDPLKPALRPEEQVSPDKLADQIAKDPVLYARWKAIREFVGKIDEQVGKNLEQSAGGSQEPAKHWKDRVPQAKETVPQAKKTESEQRATSEDQDPGVGFGLQRT
jgi:hypothetical protein